MKEIFQFLNNYTCDSNSVNRIIASAYLSFNDLKVKSNILIKKLSINKKSKDYHILQDFNKILRANKHSFDLEDLVQLFEFVISPREKEVNGAIYTPKRIRHYIINQTDKNTHENSTIGDISCGCGGFLYDYAFHLRKKYNKPYSQIFKNNIFGVDIAEYSIERTKIILSLLAIKEGEDKKNFQFNLFVGNSLSFNWIQESKKIKHNGGFDIIVGNPPYVGSSNIDEESKKLLSNWKVTSSGKADLYIPFFEIGMKWLKQGGVLGYITVNTFYKSINGRAIRNFFYEEKYNFKLIDFGGEQIFKNRNTYTCICLISKINGDFLFIKTKSKNINSLEENDFSIISYNNLKDTSSPWKLNNNSISSNIKKIENQGVKLGDLFPIRNGFATLRNNIYLFKPESICDKYYSFSHDGILHKIEKEICRDAIKPNILKHESNIEELREKLIFPYTSTGKDLFKKYSNNVRLITELEFEKKYENAYRYLESFKEELSKRDKGKRKYSEWYAYGRSQALNLVGKKLLFPYISNKPYFVYTNQENLLFYNGYAIMSDSEEDLMVLQKILKSSVFWYYIQHTSKPYSNNYYSLSKNYIKNFGICQLSKKERRRLINLKRQSSINKFLIQKYNLDI